jgi:cytochrome P450
VTRRTREALVASIALDRDFDPFDPRYRADPFPCYRLLLENAPVWWNERFGEWVFSRYGDCEGILRDPRWSSNPEHLTNRVELGGMDLRTTLRDVDAGVLLFMDPPDHTRLRRLVSQAFTPRAVERLRPRIQELVNGILDEMAAEREVELMTTLAFPLPVVVICQLLGVPAEDREMFGPWSSDASRLLDGDIDVATANRGVVAVMQLINYLNGLFDERRTNPRDDLLSALIAAEEEGDKLSESELRSVVVLLFIAGHETTMNLIGNGVLALLRHPEELARLRDDPNLDATAVEELLRYDGPVHFTGRVATEDLVVADQLVPRGQQVVTLLAAANRDPERFKDPDRLDVGRADNRHLTFSAGIHYCLGAALARVEGQVAMGSLVRRFPKLALADANPPYRDHVVLRGLQELRLSLR